MNYQIVFFCGSALHGPNMTHCAGSGRTFAQALQRARARLATYGPVGALYYRRPGDGALYPLIGA